jgi:two-component system, OmpR family, response regulator AdeR
MDTFQPPLENTANKASARQSRAKVILIIEDEFDIRNFVSRVLELEGYQVLQAGDGKTGMEIIKENSIDLVLLDLRLPELDGWSILRQMKHTLEFSQIPVVVLTAIAESGQRRRTLRMGATQYLIKPLSANSLSKTIAGILRRKGSRYQTVRGSAASRK